ncbi:MAG: AAA family ATPase [Candidatus Limnocylindria bacterium]
MGCSQCGTENLPGAKFCSECAAPLARTCPSCGTGNSSSAKFCSECATALAPSQGSGNAPAKPPVAERRLVTVLFADIVGFTPFAEERDAEEVRETLLSYFEIARETVERYGGTVEKFIGDAVMAVWGTPTAREDDAERAVRAAMDLTDNVRALGETIHARAGVLSGEAAVTLGATDQGMVAGDLVNTAARLQSVAEPGTVLVGESTMRAASAAIVFEEAGTPALKGKQSSVPAFRAVRVVAERGGRNRSGGLEAPFVGREEELRQLKDQYHAVTRERRPRLVSIMGPAGIGKSRLAWEFLKYIDGVLEPVWWHSGRSPAYGEGITFWALGEMIRTRAGLAETDDEATTRAGLAAMLAEHVPDEAERYWIEPAMLTLLGIGDPSGGSEQLFAAWRTFFERMAATGSVALVFEDLHWADSGLLDFIDHLLEWTRDLPIYIVTLARPELLEKRPTWGAGKRQFTSLFLEPLPESAMRALLNGLIPGLPEGAIRAIVTRADGVPLYAVETVRTLVAEGRLVEQDGAYVPTGELSRLAVPETLTALIASRLDALEPADRALLQDASVLGQSFTIDGVMAVTRSDGAELEPRLRALVRRELLVLRADPRAPDRGQYAFVQSLIREVAYNTLARADRKARHLAAARHFESLSTDELAGALAGHYLSAHEMATVGPEADALAAQARIALKAAADRASVLGAHDQAFRFLEQALRVTADPAEQAELHERAGASAASAARHDEAIDHFTKTRELQADLGDRSRAAAAAAEAARTLLDTYRPDQALELLEAARQEYADLDGDPILVALDGQLARAYFFLEQAEHAIETADRVLAVAEHLNLVHITADTLVTKGTALIMVGRSREGLMLISGGGQLAEANDMPDAALRAAINRGFAESLDDPRAALASAREGLALARRLGLRSFAVVLTGNAAEFAIRSGEWERAEADIRSIGDIADRSHRVIVLAGLAVFAAARGEDPSRELAELETITQELGDPATTGQFLATAARVATFQGRDADARRLWLQLAPTSGTTLAETLSESARAAWWMKDTESLRADLDRFAGTGSFGRAIEATLDALTGGLAALEERETEAISLFRQARRVFRDLDLPFDDALTCIGMVAVLAPSSEAYREAVTDGRRLLTQLGCPPLLLRLDTLIGRQSTEGAAATKPIAETTTQISSDAG